MSIDTLVSALARPPAEFSWALALERPASEPLKLRLLPSLTTAARTPPRPDEVVLWFGAPGPGTWSELLVYLDEAERARAARFRFEVDRWSFTAAHAGLRVLLAPMLGCAPQALRFTADAGGKPRLDRDHHDMAVHFNISHTRDCVAISLAGCPVGVDVERKRALGDLMALARKAFAPEGCRALEACVEGPARIVMFYRLWTLGEAFIKATGAGIAQDLTSFAFTNEGTPALTRVSEDWGPLERWRFHCNTERTSQRDVVASCSQPDKSVP